MACNFPLRGYQRKAGAPVLFGDSVRRDQPGIPAIAVPCGKCLGCQMARAGEWAMRCWHEAQVHELNCFVTLTYDDEHVPKDGNLNVEAPLLFVRRMHERLSSSMRYFLCGEYGSQEGRPHYHALLFGFDFPDRVQWKRGGGGAMVDTSDLLRSLWPYGFSSVGSLTFESAAYVARYCTKKIGSTEQGARSAEFTRMSLRPGIGAGWLRSFQEDVYPFGKVTHRGREFKAPRYYDKLYRRGDEPRFVVLRDQRLEDMKDVDQSSARLRAREEIMKARGKLLKRDL